MICCYGNTLVEVWETVGPRRPKARSLEPRLGSLARSAEDRWIRREQPAALTAMSGHDRANRWTADALEAPEWPRYAPTVFEERPG
jgi:hypothetical protein